MAYYHSKELFSPKVWMRGYDYYRRGRILTIRRSENHIAAEVKERETYTVSVLLDPETNRIKDHSCNCPNGEGDIPCKHFAALMCALEDGETCGTGTESDKSSDIEATVGLLSEEQMRQLLIHFASDDPSIWEKILLTATGQLPKSMKHQWERDLQRLTDDMVDGDNIRFEDAYDYCCSLQEYLYDRVPDLLEKGLGMEAFELVCLVFQTAMEQKIEDLDGGRTRLATYCMEEWNKILSLASPEDQKKIYGWFCDVYKQGDLKQMFLEDYIFSAPWCGEIVPDLLAFLDEQIQCTEVAESDQQLNCLIPHRIHWMRENGATPEERQAYIQQYHRLSAVRNIEIQEAKLAEDWETALDLLKESKRLDADKAGLVARYCEQLIEIFEILHYTPAVKKELEYYLFTCPQADLKYVEKMKSLLSVYEWRNVRDKLIDSPTMVTQIYDFLANEALYFQLMDRIEATGSIQALQQYEAVLKRKFPMRCVRVYERYLHQKICFASSRQAYRSIIQTLKELEKYPDGNEDVKIIVGEWKVYYPRRTIMLEELRKAGF